MSPAQTAASTLHFVGVRTQGSSIRTVFPAWADILGLDAQLVGDDVPLDAPPERYRAVVREIADDPRARGALITTHKIGLLEACRDMIAVLDPYARLIGEVSCLSKRGGRLEGFAMDPITAGAAWHELLPPGQLGRSGGHVLCLGAGGAGSALAVHLASRAPADERPPRFIAVDARQARVDHLRRIHDALETEMELACHAHDDPHKNDALVAALPPGSVVVNATGLGKDRPGSPLTDAASFPEGGVAWDLNYRGDLRFLEQAGSQAEAHGVHVEDGWRYFLHGWSAVIAEVFGVEIGETRMRALADAAAHLRE